MDAFFAAIEERDHPQLKGLPLVVGADPVGGQGRGVVSTGNYPARHYGIHSAMPISRAWKLSEAAKRRGQPGVVFTRVNYRRYAEVSQHIMGILRKYSPRVEEGGIDEAYFDLSFAPSVASTSNPSGPNGCSSSPPGDIASEPISRESRSLPSVVVMGYIGIRTMRSAVTIRGG